MVGSAYQTLCEWFLPAHTDEKKTLERSSGLILVNIILFDIMLTLMAIAGIVFYFHSMSEENYRLALNALALICVGFSASLVVFKLTGSYTLSGNIVSLSCYLPLTYAVFITGGYHSSPLIPIFAIIPIFAFLIIGLRAGLIWGTMVIVTQIILNLSDIFGIPSWQLLSSADLQRFHSVVAPFTTLIFCTSLVIYESKNRVLKAYLFHEKNKFAHQSSHDHLTGLPNRKEFNYRIRSQIDACELSACRFCIMYIDLDGFKPINDNYGHHLGDAVLVTVAERLRRIIRTTDTAARLGGDEFAIILNDARSADSARRVSEQVIHEVSQPMHLDGHTVKVSASIGLAIFPDDGDSEESICINADAAMYKAKESKNTFCFYGKQPQQVHA